ncbi:MAG: 1-(5-phosphoribosyl)-5-[(5-phosphoribosylamino)methylideneamino]imidazole-4-carboxamide isomerase [Blastocatellia bacterium]
MLIIPAIDLKGGRCVRLTEGRGDSALIYDAEPLEVALRYESEGARLIHIVDLDGAFAGAASDNRNIIRRIAREVKVPVQVGGGVRSPGDVRILLEDIGARYVIVGTLAIEHPEAFKRAMAEFGESIIVGIDARGGLVATRGWTETTVVDAVEFAGEVASIGARRIIYTDIGRDGRLAGTNLDMTREIAEASAIPVTASGGISTIQDIQSLCALESSGVDSVIVGKALYEGRFTLQAAIRRMTAFTEGHP